MTAHDPRVTLTEVLAAHADWDFTMTGRIACICGCWAEPDAGDDLNAGRHRAHVAEVIDAVFAARLAPIRALADIEDCGHPSMTLDGDRYRPVWPGGWCAICDEHLTALRVALDAPVSASQDHDWHQPLTHCHCGRVIPCRHHDGAEGQGKGEKPADRRRCPTCGIPFAQYTHDPQGRPL